MPSNLLAGYARANPPYTFAMPPPRAHPEDTGYAGLSPRKIHEDLSGTHLTF